MNGKICGRKRPWPIFAVFPFAENNYGKSRDVSAKEFVKLPVGKLPT
jgi:hypothetical protein